MRSIDKFLALFFFVCGLSFALVPSSPVSLEKDLGLFYNPAGLFAYDSKSALLNYDYDGEDDSHLQLGLNLDFLGFSFENINRGKKFNESKWHAIHSFALWDRRLFLGQRFSAFRSSEFTGTEWLYSPGLLFRPLPFLSLGYTSVNLGQKKGVAKRSQDLGMALKFFNRFKLAYDLKDFKYSSLFVEAKVFGMNFSVKAPLGDKREEFSVSFSYPFGPYADMGLFFQESSGGLQLAYHHARNPKFTNEAVVIRVPLELPVKEIESRFSFLTGPSMSVWTLRNHFEHILHDPSTGIVIFDFSGYSGGAAISKEIQRGITMLRRSGRFVVAYLDDIRPTTLLASATASKIVAEPAARVSIQGLSSSTLYYKRFLDWVGVDVEFVRHGQYKSAVEPYTMDSMSTEARQDRESLYQDWWAGLTEDIQKRLPPDASINDFLENPMLTASSAKERRWVDTVLYIDQVPAYALKEFVGLNAPRARAVTWSPSSKKILNGSWKSRKKIALLNIEGNIDKKLEVEALELIEKVTQSSRYHALIVRINSPGGGAQSSEKIWRALRVLSESGTPVIASIGDMAASGGYYIACGADIIIAEKSSVVGSIGIFGGKINAASLLEKLKLKVETVKTHPHADAEHFSRGFTEKEKEALQIYMDDFYKRFVQIVSQATDIPQDQVDTIYGQGRVFVAEQAKKHGLVHSLGGLDRAIDAARFLAKIKNYTEIEIEPLQSKKSYINKIRFETFIQFVTSFDGEFVWALEPDLWPLLQ